MIHMEENGGWKLGGLAPLCPLAGKIKSRSDRVCAPHALAHTNLWGLFFLCWLSNAPSCLTEAMLGPQRPRASTLCGLGLGFPALYSMPAPTVLVILVSMRRHSVSL